MTTTITLTPPSDDPRIVRLHWPADDPAPATEAAPADPLTAALAAAAGEIGVCRKDREMTAGTRYAYLSDDQIMARAQPILARHGIAIVPQAMQVLEHIAVATRSGSMPGVRLLVAWSVRHESGHTLVAQTIGEAADSGDKACNKAMTAARKYLFRLLFSIPTEEDPDDHRPELEQPAGAGRRTGAQPQRQGGAPSTADDPHRAVRRAIAVAAQAVLPAESLPGVYARIAAMTPSQLSHAETLLELDGAERAEAIHNLFGVGGM